MISRPRPVRRRGDGFSSGTRLILQMLSRCGATRWSTKIKGCVPPSGPRTPTGPSEYISDNELLSRSVGPKPSSSPPKAAELNRRVARVRAARSYHEGPVLRKGRRNSRKAVLDRRSSCHLGRIARGLPEEAPAGTSMTMRFSPVVALRDRPYLSVDAGVYLSTLSRRYRPGRTCRLSLPVPRSGGIRSSGTAYELAPTTRRAS